MVAGEVDDEFLVYRTRSELRLQAAIMPREIDALMVWDLTELGNGVLEVVETAAWLQAQGVFLYVRNPDGMETHDVRGRGPTTAAGLTAGTGLQLEWSSGRLLTGRSWFDSSRSRRSDLK